MSIQSEINRITTAVSDQESLIGEIVDALAARCVVTEPLLQARTVTPTEEVQVVTPDAGYDGLSSVTVEAAQGGEGTYGWKKCVTSNSADSNTVLLLHGEDLTDSSGNGLTISNSGVTVSTAQSKFGGKSLYFNGSTAALTIKSDVFNFGSGDFTVDWWEYCTGNSATRFSLSINGGCGGVCAGGSGNGNALYMGTTGTSWDMFSGAAAFSKTANQWVHWAFVRNGTSFKTYRNGTLYWSGTASGSIYWNGAGFVVGSFLYDANHYYGGYIDEFRVSNVARWTANFTPPTEPYNNKTVVGYVVSDNVDAYPDGDFQDGYYYQKL